MFVPRAVAFEATVAFAGFSGNVEPVGQTVQASRPSRTPSMAVAAAVWPRERRAALIIVRARSGANTSCSQPKFDPERVALDRELRQIPQKLCFSGEYLALSESPRPRRDRVYCLQVRQG